MAIHAYSHPFANDRAAYPGSTQAGRPYVATLANLGAAFTEISTDVWCDQFEQIAATNYDGGTHFCQFCGSTTHEPVPVWGTYQADEPMAE